MKITFAELFQQSVIIQGAITLMVTGAWVYLIVVGKPVPPELAQGLTLIWGFYFGSKVQLAISKTVR